MKYIKMIFIFFKKKNKFVVTSDAVPITEFPIK